MTYVFATLPRMYPVPRIPVSVSLDHDKRWRERTLSVGSFGSVEMLEHANSTVLEPVEIADIRDVRIGVHVAPVDGDLDRSDERVGLEPGDCFLPVLEVQRRVDGAEGDNH